MARKHSYRKSGSDPWKRKVRHHKWADELESEAKAKEAKKAAKQAAKDEDHRKVCPYCYSKTPFKVLKHPGLAPDHPHQTSDNEYRCTSCKRLYRVNCPGTILLDGNPVIGQGSGQ